MLGLCLAYANKVSKSSIINHQVRLVIIAIAYLFNSEKKTI